MENRYKNFILSGEIDYFCLLCKEPFNSLMSVEKHLRWDKHRKFVKSQQYLPKYKSDLIYMIEDYYYCEICNSLSADVTDHIKKYSHLANKTNPKNTEKKPSLAKRNPDNSISIEDKIITQNQWNCIKDGVCFLCNSNIGRIHSHKSSFKHMVNLIQSNVKCVKNDYYRELMDDKFYCFQCFKVYENKCLTSHWSDNDISKDGKNSTSKVSTSNCDVNKQKMDYMTELLAKTEKDNFDIDVVNKTAKCLKCETVVELKYKTVDEHNYSHKDPNCEGEVYTGWYFDHGKRRSELAKYVKQNYINLNEGGSKGFCSLCNIYISPHLNVAKQHVEGAQHRGHLEIKGLVKDKKHEKPPCKLVPYITFFDVIYGPFEFYTYKVIVINDGICLDTLSFNFTCVVNDFRYKIAKCFACDVNMDLIEIKNHVKEDKHSNIILHCKVLCMKNEDNEDFVRQIPSGVYHCGYCNKVFPFWENMAKHLKSMKHDVQRKKSKVLSIICAKLYLNPLQDIENIDEYITLREIESFE